MSIPYGMHPDAFAAYIKANLPTHRIGQTIGHAAASAGTHAQDGMVGTHAYCVCTDFRISDLDDAQVHAFCSSLASVGFAPFYRKPGVNGWPAQDARHVHSLWPGAAMKEMCRAQIHDYLHGKNGLASHLPYEFRPPTKEECDAIRAAFLAHNPADN